MFVRRAEKMMRLLVERKFGNTENLIRETQDIRRLIELYHGSSFDDAMLTLFLKRVNERLVDTNQFREVFDSDKGISMMKNVIKQVSMLNLDSKVSVLGILSSTTGKYRSSVSSDAIEKILIDEISVKLNPDDCFSQYVKVYYHASELGKVNSMLEEKILRVLKKGNFIGIKNWLDLANAACMTNRTNTNEICGILVEMIGEQRIEDVKDEGLAYLTYAALIEIDARIEVDKEILKRFKKLVIEEFKRCYGKDLLDLMNLYEKYRYLDYKFYLDLLNLFVTNVENKGFIWGDLLEKVILNIDKFSRNYPEISISQNIISKLQYALCEAHKLNRIGDSEFLLSINITQRLTRSLIPKCLNYLQSKYENNETHDFFKFGLSVLLSSQCESIRAKSIEFCKSFYKMKNYSMGCYIIMYMMINSTNLKNNQDAQIYLEFIQDDLNNRIYDFYSYRNMRKIFQVNKEKLIDTALWPSVIKHVVKLFEKLGNEGKITSVYLLEQIRMLYSYDDNLDDEWKRLMKSFNGKIQPKDLTLAISRYYNETEIEASLFMLNNLPFNHISCLAHCLSIKSGNPLYRELSEATELIKKSPSSLFKDKSLIYTENSLFDLIFLKGFAQNIKSNIRQIDFSKFHNLMNRSTWTNLIISSCEYDLIEKNQCLDLISSLKHEITDNKDLSIAIESILKTGIISDNEKSEYFQLNDECDKRKFIRNINFWIKFQNSQSENDEYLRNIRIFVEKYSLDKDFFKLCIEGVSNPINENREFYTEYIEVIVGKIIENLNTTWPLLYRDFNKSLYSSFILSSIISKFYDNQAHIDYFEFQTDHSALTQDSLHHLISTYTSYKKNNDFLESSYVSAINKLNTSVFYKLSKIKFNPLQ